MNETPSYTLQSVMDILRPSTQAAIVADILQAAESNTLEYPATGGLVLLNILLAAEANNGLENLARHVKEEREN